MNLRAFQVVVYLIVFAWSSLGQAYAGSDLTPPRITRISPPAGALLAPGGEMTITFDESVVIPHGAVRVWAPGVEGDLFHLAMLNSETNTLSLSFGQNLVLAALTVVVDFTVADLTGNALDGENPDPRAASLPSGDGVAGGQFVVRYNLISPDLDADGLVGALDLALLLGSWGVEDSKADLNLDGTVNSDDLAIMRQRWGAFVIPTDGDLPQIEALTPDPIEPLRAPLSEFKLKLSERVREASVTPTALHITDAGNFLFVPVSAELDDDSQTIRFAFEPPINPCGRFSIKISNALADESGALLLQPEIPPTLEGLVPPPPPRLDPHTSMTNSDFVVISGQAFEANLVRIVGPESINAIEVVDQSFIINAPLRPNAENTLFISAVSACGIESAPIATTVTADLTPPSLHIDFPFDGQIVSDPFVDVAGRVSDLLSGFAGLSVVINGVKADVDVGIGTNGTFFLSGVPLMLEGETAIDAVATDALGNEARRSIQVMHRSIPPDAPQLQIISGNSQAGVVDAGLPKPLVVQVLAGSGSPLPNKLVTFKVKRSNGRLRADPASSLDGSMQLQVRSDSAGFARAYWALGTDAGCGNNRVEVSSRDIARVAMFCASAMAAPPSQINVGSGNNQRVEIGATAPEPLRVWISDGCNGVEGVPVTFTVTRGDGLVNGQEAITLATSNTGHAEVIFELGSAAGNHIVTASFPGAPGQKAEFVTFGVERDPTRATSLAGLIFNNSMQPIGGALVELSIGGSVVASTISTIDGQFSFDDLADSGAAHLVINGFVADTLGGNPILPGSFPSLAFEPVIVPNAANNLPAPVLLPNLDSINLRQYSTIDPTELAIAGIDGLRMIVKPGSMFIDGQPAPDGTLIALNQVHHDDIPMPMPDGAAPPFAWTLQPAGATFDPPIRIEYPNMSALPPGAIAYFLTFDHDTGSFEIVASGSVSDDGSTITTDPGSGLTLAGWGANCPPYVVTGDVSCIEDDLVRIQVENLLRSARQSMLVAEFAREDALRSIGEAAGWFSKALVLAIKLKIADLPLCLSGGNCNPAIIDLVGIADSLPPAYGAFTNSAESMGQASAELDSAVANLKSAAALCPGILPDNRPENLFDAINAALGRIAEQLALQENRRDAHESVQRMLRNQVNCMMAGGTEEECAPRNSNVPRGRGESFVLTLDDIINDFELLLAELNATKKAVQDIDELTLDALRAVKGADWMFQIGDQSSTGEFGGFQFMQNIAAADSFGVAGSIPDGLSDDFLRVMGSAVIANRTMYAFSERFQIRQGETYVLQDLTVTDVPPRSIDLLAISVADPILTQIGQVTQATVEAHFGDGETGDVTRRADWTIYRTSNPAVATVGPDGLITANGAGTAFITATNEGAGAVARIRVAPGDPLTTIEGFVRLEDGSFLGGATVSTNLGQSTSSDSSGFFRLAAVPTQLKPISIIATANVDGHVVQGRAMNIDLVPAGLSDAGLITLGVSGIPSVVPSFDFTGRMLHIFDLNGNLVEAHSTDYSGYGVAMDIDGDIWVATLTEDLLKVRLAEAGRPVISTTLPAGSRTSSVAVGPDRDVWVTDLGLNRLWRVGSDGEPKTFFDLPRPNAMGAAIGPKFDGSGEYFVYCVVHNPGGSFAGELLRFDSETGASISVTFGDNPALAVAIGPDGRVYLPMDTRGGGIDQLRIYDANLVLLDILSIPATHAWKQVRQAVVAPDGSVWVAGSDNRIPPDYLYRFDPTARTVEAILLVADGGCRPSGCFIAANGSVWTSLATCGPNYVQPVNGPGLFVSAGQGPANWGDPTGYLQAFIVHPDADFDGDGIENRAELEMGRNPFDRSD